MASEERSHSRDLTPATSHDESEWEAQRSNFYRCYIDEHMTLKDATSHMSVEHSFPASERQWERKAKNWGFVKYTPLQERIKQQQRGDNDTRNFKRWHNRQGKSGDRSGRSRSVSLGRLSASAKQEPRGRSRGQSASSGDQSPDSRGRHRGSIGTELLSPENYRHNVFDIGISPEEALKLNSSALPSKINLEATREESGSSNPLKLNVQQQYSSMGQQVAPPQLMVSMWNEEAAQLSGSQSLGFDNIDTATYGGLPSFPTLPSGATAQYLPTSFEDPPDSGIRGQGFDGGSGNIWASQGTFQSPISGIPTADDTSSQQMMFNTDSNPFGTNMIPQTAQIDSSYLDSQDTANLSQQSRNDSLVDLFANQGDPFKDDLVYAFAKYTNDVWSEIANSLQVSKIPQLLAEQVLSNIDLQRHDFFQKMQLIVEQQIRNLNTQHQAEHDLCGILRARNKVLTRIIQESAVNVDIQAELNNSSSNATMNYWTQTGL